MSSLMKKDVDVSYFTDILVVGGGASGLMAALTAAQHHKKVIICEHMNSPGLKLLATGGGRCNLTNKLPKDEFMREFGRFGRFMEPALSHFFSDELTLLLNNLGVPTHAPDGFHVFPASQTE